jgi:transcription initiation factor TFIIA large subunit
MPWDPPAHQIAPPAQQAQMSAVKSEVKDSGITAQNGEGVQVKTEGGYDSQIKQEPNYEEVPSYPALNGYQGNAINPMAGHRAANQLLQQFGTQANASIRAAGLPQQPRPLALPGHQQQQQPPQQQRPQQLQLPGQPQQAQQANRYPLGSAQNDGAAEDASLDSLKQQWDQFVLEVRNTTSEERAAADGALKQMILGDEEAEESQLMIPDNERRIKRRRRPQRARDPTPLTHSERMQVDGGDESADEDAINSDLDDSEEDLDGQQAEEDGPLGEMILCTWDKVNRVKNKVCCLLYC